MKAKDVMAVLPTYANVKFRIERYGIEFESVKFPVTFDKDGIDEKLFESTVEKIVADEKMDFILKVADEEGER